MNPDNSFDFDIETRNRQDAARAIFYSEPKLDGAETAKEGRPIHKMVDYVKILIPGSKDEFVTVVRPEDKERFPREWAAYQNREKQAINGTPLESWPAVDRATVANCRHLNIMTVEDLIGLDDVGLGKLGPGGRKLQEKARLFLQAAKDDAIVYQQQSEIEQLRSEIDQLKEQLAAVEPKRGPGRPPKSEAA